MHQINLDGYDEFKFEITSDNLIKCVIENELSKELSFKGEDIINCIASGRRIYILKNNNICTSYFCDFKFEISTIKYDNKTFLYYKDEYDMKHILCKKVTSKILTQ